MDADGFVVVQHSKKGKSKFNKRKNQCLIEKNIQLNLQDKEINKQVDENGFCKKIRQLEEEFSESEFFTRFTHYVLASHGLVVQSENKETPHQELHGSANRISKIICLGLGNFTSSKQAEYQLVFLNCLVKVLNLNQTKESVSVFDPVHTPSEAKILNHLGFECNPQDNNLEGRYALKEQKLKETLFYLPHCPKQLTNNILWANWSPKSLGSTDPKCADNNSLLGLHILGNSFDRITYTFPDRILKDSAEYILLCSRFVFETKVENCFKFSDIFNDTSLHSFPFDKLPPFDDPVWKVANEKEPPTYKEDKEFISSNLSNISK